MKGMGENRGGKRGAYGEKLKYRRFHVVLLLFLGLCAINGPKIEFFNSDAEMLLSLNMTGQFTEYLLTTRGYEYFMRGHLLSADGLSAFLGALPEAPLSEFVNVLILASLVGAVVMFYMGFLLALLGSIAGRFGPASMGGVLILLSDVVFNLIALLHNSAFIATSGLIISFNAILFMAALVLPRAI